MYPGMARTCGCYSIAMCLVSHEVALLLPPRLGLWRPHAFGLVLLDSSYFILFHFNFFVVSSIGRAGS